MPRTSIHTERTVKPFQLRDFSKGRVSKSSTNTFLIPPNSVAGSININYETILGSGVVRPGTTLLGSNVVSNKTPLGLVEFVGISGTPNLQLAVFTGASNATLYYFDTSWHTTTLTTLSNTNKHRFATIGGRSFMVNGTSSIPSTPGWGMTMVSSKDGITWNSTNCTPQQIITMADGSIILGPIPNLIMRTGQRLITGSDSSSVFPNKDRIYFSSIISQTPIKRTATALTNDLGAGFQQINVNLTAHGYTQFQQITVEGANQPDYNGSFFIETIVDANNFIYYAFASPAPVSPATGTIKIFTPQLTWNTNSVTGDWIDINPDDGDNLTAFAEASAQVLVFKSRSMYRLDLVNKSTDSSNIFNVGAVSQEAVTVCQGLCYFYSGGAIFRTNGGFPQQISRLGCQDFLDAIPAANKPGVSLGSDLFNVYFSIGNVTIGTGRTGQRTYNNVVLKFSTRDETWSIHYYAQQPGLFSQFTTPSNDRQTLFADTSGNVQMLNVGLTDNGTPIFFELETQEQEVGNRAHEDSITDNIAVFTNNGIDTKLQVRTDDGDYKDVDINLSNRINIGDGVNVTNAHYVTFKWSGTSTGAAPVFEGIYVEAVVDEGLIPTQ